jgi:solute carrier family 25 thiamine pyrophosphate transporter 19
MLFLCGASAAILATAATYPFDIMRTQFSLQGNTKIYASIPAFISTTLQKQGVKGFCAGLGPTLVGVTPYIGLNFALYDIAKKAVESSEEDAKGKNSIMSTVKKSIAGGFAGTTSKLMVYPLDTIKRRMQASVLQSTIVVAGGAAAAPQYKNMLDCCTTIFRNEGLQGLYRGVGPTILKSCVSTAVTFAAYEQGLLIAKKMRAEREG